MTATGPLGTPPGPRPRGLGPPPLGFCEQQGPAGVAWLREDVADALQAAGFSAAAPLALPRAEVKGRAALAALTVAGRPALVREFSRGGLAGRLARVVGRGDTFGDGTRPFTELHLSERLAAIGIPVATALGARAERTRGGWRLALATWRLGDPGGGERDLAAWLADHRRGAVSPRAAQRLARAAARLVARLHEVGFLHADLQPANLFVVGDPAREAPIVHALDLDRSRFFADLDTGARCANLARLWRHLSARDAALGPSTSRTDRARFLSTWAAATRRGHKPAAARTLWRTTWRTIDELESRRRWLHTLGRRLRGSGPG